MMAKVFEKMMEYVFEEANDSEKYAKLALKYKADHPDLAKMFEDMSADEYKHMKMLCDHLTKLAGAHEEKHIPIDMVAAWNYVKGGMLHEQSMRIKHLHGTYSGS